MLIMAGGLARGELLGNTKPEVPTSKSIPCFLTEDVCGKTVMRF